MEIKMDISGILIPIKKKGITINIAERGLHQGHFVINQKCLIWYKGKARNKAAGKRTWTKLIKEMIQEKDRGSRKIKKWDLKDRRLLKKLYRTMPATQIVKKMKRTLPSVRGKIAALGLRKR